MTRLLLLLWLAVDRRARVRGGEGERGRAEGGGGLTGEGKRESVHGDLGSIVTVVPVASVDLCL